MKNEGIPVVREGFPFLIVFAVASLAFFVGGWWPLGLLFLFLFGYTVYFFRNPERLPPVGSQVVASPADGKVIFIGQTKEAEFSHEEMLKISIFMSLIDVHVNRAPVDGTVKNMRYHRGRFMAAYEDHASDENERNAMFIETNQGKKIVLVQIAGLVARRIVSYPAPGSFILKGQRIGLIRFGSRCDLYLPLGSDIKIKMGEQVLGGETILAELKDGA